MPVAVLPQVERRQVQVEGRDLAHQPVDGARRVDRLARTQAVADQAQVLPQLVARAIDVAARGPTPVRAATTGRPGRSRDERARAPRCAAPRRVPRCAGASSPAARKCRRASAGRAPPALRSRISAATAGKRCRVGCERRDELGAGGREARRLAQPPAEVRDRRRYLRRTRRCWSRSVSQVTSGRDERVAVAVAADPRAEPQGRGAVARARRRESSRRRRRSSSSSRPGTASKSVASK